MTARIISGTALAASLRAELAQRVQHLAFKPGLAVVLVGDDPASAVYVRNKDRAALAVGLDAQTFRLEHDTTQAELLDLVHRLNANDSVDGILVQFPLPPHLDSKAVIVSIDPAKDVDGFHPINVGRLAGRGCHARTLHTARYHQAPAGERNDASRRAGDCAGSVIDRRDARSPGCWSTRTPR